MCKVPKLFMVVNRILQKMNFMKLSLNSIEWSEKSM